MALSTLVVDLILKAAGFESDMARASKTAQKRMKEIEKEAKALGKAMGVALAAGATAVAVAIKSAIDRADEMNKSAQLLGLTTEQLSRLEYAAKLSDVALETLTGSFVKMTKVQAEAVTKGSAAAQVFEAFGVDAIDPLTGKLRDSEAVFRDWADVLSRLDAPERLAVGMEVFGKSFKDIEPLIRGGSAALDEFGAESDRIGNTVSTGVGLAADEFNDRLDTLKATIGGVALQLAAELLPQLISLEGELQRSAESGEAARSIAQVFHVIEIAARLVAGAVQFVADTIQAMVSTGVSQFHRLSGVVKTMRLDIAGAREEFRLAEQERDAAAFAYKETQNHNWTGGGDAATAPAVQWIDAPSVAEHAATMRAKAQAKEFLDAQNRRAKEAAAARAASQAAAAGNRAAAEAAREAAQAEKERAQALKESQEASAEFATQLQDLSDELAGPLAQASTQYKRDQEGLKKLAEEGKVSAADLASAQELLGKAYAKTTAEIEKRLHPEREALAELQFYIAASQAATLADRDRLEIMREFPDASKAMVDQIVESREALREAGEAINVADGIRDSFEDAFADILTGAKSVKDAFKDLAASILADIARVIAKRMVAQIFGEPGTTGAGSPGGGFLSAIASFLTGNALGNAFDGGNVTAFASGGIVNRPTVFPMARGMGLMGEAGPEAVMPLKRLADGKLGVHSGGRSPVINISVDGATTKETAQQIATKVAQAMAFAGRAA